MWFLVLPGQGRAGNRGSHHTEGQPPATNITLGGFVALEEKMFMKRSQKPLGRVPKRQKLSYTFWFSSGQNPQCCAGAWGHGLRTSPGRMSWATQSHWAGGVLRARGDIFGDISMLAQHLCTAGLCLPSSGSQIQSSHPARGSISTGTAPAREHFGNVLSTAAGWHRSARVFQLFPQKCSKYFSFSGFLEAPFSDQKPAGKERESLLAGGTGASWPGRAAAPPE